MIQTQTFDGGLKTKDDHIKRPKHTMPSSPEDNYETPEDIYYEIVDLVKQAMQPAPEFDPFALKDRGDGKTNSKCTHYLTKEENAYATDWIIKEVIREIIPTSIWINHPHTEHERTIIRITEQYKKYKFCVVLFIPANTMGTTYWDEYIEPHRIGGNPKYKHVTPKHIIAFPFDRSIRFLLNGKPATGKNGKPEFSRNRYMIVIWKSKQ